MFIILTYDIGVKRINRVRKLLKKYLVWTQNSVFEGEISEGKLHKCLHEVERMIDKNVDSVYVYVVRSSKNIEKSVIGEEKSCDELFL